MQDCFLPVFDSSPTRAQARAMNAICTPFDRHVALQTTSQVDCRSGFDSTQCDAASLGGTVSYPIDWTVGTGAVVNEDWSQHRRRRTPQRQVPRVRSRGESNRTKTLCHAFHLVVHGSGVVAVLKRRARRNKEGRSPLASSCESLQRMMLLTSRKRQLLLLHSSVTTCLFFAVLFASSLYLSSHRPATKDQDRCP